MNGKSNVHFLSFFWDVEIYYTPVQKYINFIRIIHFIKLCARNANMLPGQHLLDYAFGPEVGIWLLLCLSEFAFYTGPQSLHPYTQTWTVVR